MPTDTTPTAHPTDPLLTAKLEPKPTARALLGYSRMWWLALAALVVAGVLVWRSTAESGTEIIIHFPEGHGLAVGDFLRHRGIEVGHIDRIQLADDLSGIQVSVTLFHSAEALAREGSKFWIVRPEISLTEVRGLDTAVGAKYIAVRPGDAKATVQQAFQGLAAAPPGDAYGQGMEVVLRGDASYGLSVAAPVTWRGVDVGEVLSVDLASDTRYVDVRIRIGESYRNLVRDNSKFWATSGLGIEAGITGLSLRAESLTTIARGGVSFITPAGSGNDGSVRAGHVYKLHIEEDPDWTKEASSVGLIDFPLPATIIVRTSWKEKRFGFTRSRRHDMSGILVSTDDSKSPYLLAPAEDVLKPSEALGDSWNIELVAPGQAKPLHQLNSAKRGAAIKTGCVAWQINFDFPGKHLTSGDHIRAADEPEDCCLVRSVASSEGPSTVIHPLSRTELSVGGAGWQVNSNGADLEDWHGAAVVAMGDGALIGQFIASDSGPIIWRLELPQSQAAE